MNKSLLLFLSAMLAGGLVVFALYAALFMNQTQTVRQDPFIREDYPAIQPIEFNHSIHVEAGTECSACHQGIENHGDFYDSTAPKVAVCENCHARPETSLSEPTK